MIAALYFIFFFLIYFPLSIWIIRKSYRFAKAKYRRGWAGGVIAAFIMYNLVFWDFIPTLVAHKYYCSTQAGFWVYKTPEQWREENPEILEKINITQNSTDYKIEKIPKGFKSTYSINKRIKESRLVTFVLTTILDINRVEELKIDCNNFILTKKISFYAGRISGAPKDIKNYKFWVNLDECSGRNGNSSITEWFSSNNQYSKIGLKND